MSHDHPPQASWLFGRKDTCPTPAPSLARPWHLVLLGPPGVGKGTQAQLRARHLRACHLSTGDIFRAALKTPACACSPALSEALTAMRGGLLVSDETVVSLVRERSHCLRCHGGFLLDGFPRTRAQAVQLDQILSEIRIPLDAAIAYTLDEEQVVERLSLRRVCGGCRRSWHLKSLPPKKAGTCDACGSPLIHRPDDFPDVIRARLQEYRAHADPVLDFYRERGCLREITADGDPETILGKTLESIGFDPQAVLAGEREP